MLDRHRTSGWFFEIYFKCLYFYRVLNRKLLYKINVEVLIYSIGRILFSVWFNFTLLLNVAYNDFFVWSNNCFVIKGNKIMLRKVVQSRKSHTFIPINRFYLEKVSNWGAHVILIQQIRSLSKNFLSNFSWKRFACITCT